MSQLPSSKPSDMKGLVSALEESLACKDFVQAAQWLRWIPTSGLPLSSRHLQKIIEPVLQTAFVFQDEGLLNACWPLFDPVCTLNDQGDSMVDMVLDQLDQSHVSLPLDWVVRGNRLFAHSNFFFVWVQHMIEPVVQSQDPQGARVLSEMLTAVYDQNMLQYTDMRYAFIKAVMSKNAAMLDTVVSFLKKEAPELLGHGKMWGKAKVEVLSARAPCEALALYSKCFSLNEDHWAEMLLDPVIGTTSAEDARRWLLSRIQRPERLFQMLQEKEKKGVVFDLPEFVPVWDEWFSVCHDKEKVLKTSPHLQSIRHHPQAIHLHRFDLQQHVLPLNPTAASNKIKKI